MAYFLPSFIQKRLLRYALSRLDFIETDALNLDDLDITLGQRSIIELKNVGIRVSKLIEQVPLPPTILLNRASIRLLRITVPADLHVSGIAVEVDGVEVEIFLKEDESTPRKTSRSGPSHADIANRPRIASPHIHDPGGDAHHGRQSYGEHSRVIPTSQDLAMSFLESETRQERRELEAVIQSQSYRLQESTDSLGGSTDESGIGMPGGFSLPGFVANFFSGVADRLSVKMTNITASIAMKLGPDSPLGDTMRVMVYLSSISLDSLDSEEGAQPTNPKRSLTIDGFQVFLLSEAESFFRPSATSSPKLTKSRSKMSSSSDEDSRRQPPSEDARLSGLMSALQQSHRQQEHPHRADLSSDGSTSSSQLADLSVDLGDPMLSSSHPFKPSLDNADYTHSIPSLPNSGQGSPVDNRKHAEAMMGSSMAEEKSFRGLQDSVASTEDLAESRMFTHDQAESMYMSAVSSATDNQGMPGAWHSFQHAPLERGDLKREDQNQSSRPDSRPLYGKEIGVESPFARDTIAPNREGSIIDDNDEKFVPDMSISDLSAKQLLHVDHFAIRFRTTHSEESSEVPQYDSIDPHKRRGSRALSQSSRGISKPAATTEEAALDTGSRMLQSVYPQSFVRDFAVSNDYQFETSVGTVTINLDMSIGRMLVAGAPHLSRVNPQSTGKENVTKTPKAETSSSLRLSNLLINICQNVPEVPASQLYQTVGGGQNVTSTCLLQLGMSNIRHEIATNATEMRQRLAVEKIVLGHSSQKYLYFIDSMSLRDSVATSQVLKPDDLVIVNLNDRCDVQMKPVHAVVDLLKVDDVLSRSGGLSSILDLGNSVMSTGTVTGTSPRISSKPLPVRQRAVRFDSPAPRPRAESDASAPGLKVDIRISGGIVDLVGSESSMQIRSSAIKLVSRTGNFRAQIDTVALAGPVFGRSQTKPGVSIRISNLSINFRDSPDEQDLDRLLSLLTPSSDKYDDEDDIMVDTLIRQRRKGAVLQLNIGEVKVDVIGIAWLKHITRLGDELSKLATVTKYLPEDDRPGMLLFALVNKINVNIDLGRSFGMLHLVADLVEGALISVPSLMAAQISSLSLKRGNQILLGDVIPNSQDQILMGPPMLMCRFIADEMEPTVRIKVSNACCEYTVPTVIAFTDLLETMKSEPSQSEPVPSSLSSEASSVSERSDLARKIQISINMRNSAIALNPDKGAAKGLFLLSDTVFTYGSKHDVSRIKLDLRKASILIIDDVAKLGHESTNADHKLYFEENDQVQELTKAGYIPVGSISNASAIIKIFEEKGADKPVVDVEFRNNLFYLETCADSTQTLIQVLSNLAPPTPPSPIAKYRTEVVPIEDMLASFTGNAFVSEPGPELGLQASQVSTSTANTDNYRRVSRSRHQDDYTDDDDDEDEDDDGDEDDDEEYPNHMLGSGLYQDDDEYEDDTMAESYLESDMSQSRMTGSLHVAPVDVTASPDPPMEQSIMAHSMLDFRTDHFVSKTSVGGTAHRWNSSQNTYGLGSETPVQQSPLKVRVRDMHIIWNLFDGYDWQSTRETISQAVKDIETKAMARQPRRDSRLSPGAEEDESVIGDFLFNSIYIGIPANKDPRELTNVINQELGDAVSETGSYATGTTVTAIPSGRAASTRGKPKKLRLNRSKQHKMTFELKGVSADFIAFPAGSGEIESSVDVRVRALEVFDHVPTSTWRKFATYMHEAGEREVDTNMVHLELLNVKPIAELAASEMVIKITILPLRLHVDQDALDFMTRFFEFKDERAVVSPNPSPPPFLQRVEVNPVRLMLDFKPKRVDYGGLRSGRTTEFMNFFVLDRSDMVLRRVILYGVSGFDRLGIMLNNIWSPDVRNNQLPGVLAGLAPIRSLVDVGSGVKDLVAVPIREYKKDGRIVRSIQKGAIAFAKTTTTELVNLGAKLAIGTQTVLQNAEGILVPKPQGEDDGEEKEQISLYADQPIGIMQGLRGAYASLERDLLLAKDAIVAIPGEVVASGSATGAAKAIIKQSPTIILRPAIGATKAVGQTLLGAGNTLDKGNLRRVEEKYKRR